MCFRKVTKYLRILGVCVLGLTISFAALNASALGASDKDLQPYLEANIDWKQFEGKSINVLSLPHAYLKVLNENIDIFERLTGIKCNMAILGEDEMRRKRSIDLSTGAGMYDVILTGLSIFPQFSKAGWIKPLNEYVDDPSLTDKQWYNLAGISPGGRAANSSNNLLLAMPVEVAGPIMFYRTDILEKYGLEPPKTWEEIAAWKTKLQPQLDSDPEYKGVFAFCSRAKRGAGNNTWTISPCIRSYGGHYFDKQWKPVFNSPEAVKALDIYKAAQTGYGNPQGSEAIDFYDLADLLASGKLACAIAGNSWIVILNDPNESKVYGKWDATYMPMGTEAKRYTSYWTWALSINYKSQKPKPAWLFIQWATSEPTMKLVGSRALLSRTILWDTLPSFTELKEKGWLKASKWTVEPNIPEFREIGEVISVAFSDILLDKPTKETLDKAAKEVEKIMEKSGYYD